MEPSAVGMIGGLGGRSKEDFRLPLESPFRQVRGDWVVRLEQVPKRAARGDDDGGRGLEGAGGEIHGLAQAATAGGDDEVGRVEFVHRQRLVTHRHDAELPRLPRVEQADAVEVDRFLGDITLAAKGDELLSPGGVDVDGIETVEAFEQVAQRPTDGGLNVEGMSELLLVDDALLDKELADP